ncbi:MAG: signal recognition particle receptor subunit alpha, partial [Ornithinimicrobium sp.]
MDDLWIYLTVATVIVLIALVGLVALTRSRRTRSEELPPSAGPADSAPSTLDDADRPSAGAAPDVDTVDTRGGEEDLDVDIDESVTIERPDSARGRLARLRARLARSNTAIGNALLALLSRGGLDEEAWEDVEDTLLQADLGVEATEELVAALRTRVKIEGESDAETVRGWLRSDLLTLVDPAMDRRISASRVGERAAVVLVVGVNGTGKTTTVGKLARVLVAENKDVMLGAADTYRAAAADQLQTWGERVGVPTIRSDREGADPASVAFDAVKSAGEYEADVVIIDTAGRLHNKAGLMDELSKV